MALLVALAAAVALVSGGSAADPRTPSGLPGLPAPFLGTAVVGDGGLTAAIDAYGNVVDLRAPGPAGQALIDNPVERQAAGTVAPGTGIVPRVRVGGAWLPLWRADAVAQRYRRDSNVVEVEAIFGSGAVRIVYAAQGGILACLSGGDGSRRASIGGDEPAAHSGSSWSSRLHCNNRLARATVRRAEQSDRRWLARARPLGSAAPTWAAGLYRRSLLALRALTDRRTGAVAAGARDGWAYVWPRDAGAAALAFAAAGYGAEARRAARFLRGLDLEAAARFYGDGSPVPGRAAQGDAWGWTAAAAQAAGLPAPPPLPWRDRADYQERDAGDYLGNALAASAQVDGRRRLTRRPGDPESGLDSVAAWAVRPFPQPSLFPAARRTLLRLAAEGTSFGIVPGQDWDEVDPWSAPTAWTAWSLAALRERFAALRLLAALRRSATPAGVLPERVDARTGIPASTTPLAWSHAFAVLALRELWP